MVTGTSQGKLVPIQHRARTLGLISLSGGSVELLDMPLCTHFTFLIKIEQLRGPCPSLIFVLWMVKCEPFSPALFSLCSCLFGLNGLSDKGPFSCFLFFYFFLICLGTLQWAFSHYYFNDRWWEVAR